MKTTQCCQNHSMILKCKIPYTFVLVALSVHNFRFTCTCVSLEEMIIKGQIGDTELFHIRCITLITLDKLLEQRLKASRKYSYVM